MNYFNFDNKPKKFFSPNICLIYDEISRNKLEAKHYMKGCAFKKIPLIEKSAYQKNINIMLNMLQVQKWRMAKLMSIHGLMH